MFNLKGVDSLFENQGAEFSTIPLDMIEVKSQVREIFEDEDNSLADLAENIKKQGVLQPILLRPTDDGYELIAGERRLRAAKIAGLDMIPAYIREMSDEEAENAQFSENVHRKNLTQIEEAKKLQRDIDRLGSVEAVCELHQKSHSWLSKRLSLLALPEQTKRLVTEDISADIEAINTVKTIEKRDPEAAQILVDKLKETGGKNARDEAAAVKATVKPPKTKKQAVEIVEEQIEVFDTDRSGATSSFDVIENIAKNMGATRIQTLIKEREELKREKARIDSRLASIADEIENIESRV
jgi:ParB family chromosome partitioning protein